MTTAISGLLALCLYLAGTGLQVHALRQESPSPRRRLIGITFAGALVHAVAVAGLLLTPEGLDLGLFRVAALVSLAAICLILAFTLTRPLENLFVVMLPFAALTLAAALAFESTFDPIPAPAPGFVIHVVLAILAYAVLALAVCQALVTGWQERQLRRHRSFALLGTLPPLQTMERLLFEILWVGLGLLTLAIASGLYFLEDLFEQRVVHHTVLSSSSWIVFAILLLGRYRLGWRGRTAIRWTLTGFALLMLAYFGSKLVIEVILGA